MIYNAIYHNASTSTYNDINSTSDHELKSDSKEESDEMVYNVAYNTIDISISDLKNSQEEVHVYDYAVHTHHDPAVPEKASAVSNEYTYVGNEA